MRIAVVGSGISGMTAAHLLSRQHEVTLYEADNRIGGHTHTIDVTVNGTRYPVDTGFIVFNEKTYPNFVALMRQLGVSWQPSDMSFSVQCAKTGLEFKPSTLNSLFAQRRNLFRPSFYRMLLDALRFQKESGELLDTGDDSLTLSEYLRQNAYSRGFIEHLILPMGAAIWSSSPGQFQEFPARYFIEFFENHGFLNVRHQPRWQVIRGGSRTYIAPLTRPFQDRIRVNTPVDTIRRLPDSVEVCAGNGGPEPYDHVVIAAHSDQALAMLSDPTPEETDVLGSIAYQANDTVLHTDAAVMPRRRAAWASWNYMIPKEGSGRVALTYNMNRLQTLDAPEEFCVTLNMPDAIAPDRVIASLLYHHPVYSPESLVARRRRDTVNGRNRTWYCGAYWYYGFHEDGVKSALDVCRGFGIEL